MLSTLSFLILALGARLLAAAPLTAQEYLIASPLPYVIGSQPTMYAGRIPVNATSNPDDALFFWMVKSANATTDKLVFWFNGGPGCSSMLGMWEEQGPFKHIPWLHLLAPNPYSWHLSAHIVFIDQPLGVGFSFSNTFVSDESAVGAHFYGFLTGFYNVFPELRNLALYLTGESYAGMYIPYIATEILNRNSLVANNKINIRAIAIGDGLLSDDATQFNDVVIPYMDEQNMWNGDATARQAFVDDFAKCQNLSGSNLAAALHNLGSFETLSRLTSTLVPYSESNNVGFTWPSFLSRGEGYNGQSHFLGTRDTELMKRQGVNFTSIVDFCNNVWDYAASWYQNNVNPCFNVYDILDKSCGEGDWWLSDLLWNPQVITAIHANYPANTSLKWSECVNNVLREDISSLYSETLLPAILEQIPVVLYSGDKDFILNHFGTERVISQLTWKNQTGFLNNTLKEFEVDSRAAGKWHTERGLTYALIYQAGHQIPEYQPQAALYMLNNFILSL